jgi:hypothetical protein
MRSDPPHGLVSTLLRLDEMTGDLRWLADGKVAGPSGRVVIGEFRIPTLRAAWVLVHGQHAKGAVVPLDGNKLNLRPGNLMDCGAVPIQVEPAWPESGPGAPRRPLSQGEQALNQRMAREIFTYDRSTGAMCWKVDRRTSNGSLTARAGELVGGLNDDGYFVVNIVPPYSTKPCSYLVHRVIWLMETGQWPLIEIDHRNGVRSDNRWQNLRDISRKGNSENLRKAHKSNLSTGLLGAYYQPDKGTFRSAIKSDGRWIGLGTFETPEEAHQAYVDAKRRLHAGGTL